MADQPHTAEPFNLRLYRPPQCGKWSLVGLDFQIHAEPIFEHKDPVLKTLGVDTLDYGHLFAYCFRRFGFPNMGSDSYKDIAQWFLTTPRTDLVLCVRPSVCEESHFSIHFRTTPENERACRNWERKDIEAWTDRKLDWIEAQGLPEWLPSLVASYAEQMQPGANWRDCYRGYIVMFTPREGDFHSPFKSEAEAEHHRLLTGFASRAAGYEKIEPRTEFRKRSMTVAEWPEDDPMKPLAEAAIEALRDLKTGVRVRDAAINAFGVMDDGFDAVEEPECAGLGTANLINEAPNESVELYQIISRLGEHDLRVGIKRLIELAKEADPGVIQEKTESTECD